MPSDFKAVAWMRKRREEIDLEDEGLDWAQKSERTAKALSDDPLWKRLLNRKLPARASSKR